MRKEIINRNGSKILQDSDILLKPLNIIDIFTDVLHSAFKLCVENAIFRSILKATDVNPVFKKTVELAKTITIIDLLVRLQRFWRYMKDICGLFIIKLKYLIINFISYCSLHSKFWNFFSPQKWLTALTCFSWYKSYPSLDYITHSSWVDLHKRLAVGKK